MGVGAVTLLCNWCCDVVGSNQKPHKENLTRKIKENVRIENVTRKYVRSLSGCAAGKLAAKFCVCERAGAIIEEGRVAVKAL